MVSTPMVFVEPSAEPFMDRGIATPSSGTPPTGCVPLHGALVPALQPRRTPNGVNGAHGIRSTASAQRRPLSEAR
ncbi:hypothetical protein GCM10010350_47830 [Streptomyces galilaeus]|nr:hypothetical protein GCM10010350_47830 [Streptomyces galilaeus]